MAIRRALCVLGAAGYLAAGCGGSQPPEEQGPTMPDVVNEDTRLSDLEPFVRVFTAEGLLLNASDINLDGRPDNFEFFAVLDANGEQIFEFEDLSPYDTLNLRIVRKEIDVNFDGSVDVVRTYNRQQELTREELDVNFDGSVDFINHFEDSVIVRRQIDNDNDGVFEETRFYREGALYRVEKDTDGDFIPDYWEFYLDGTLARIGRDFDADGIIDNWTLAETEEGAPDIVQTDEYGNLVNKDESEGEDDVEDVDEAADEGEDIPADGTQTEESSNDEAGVDDETPSSTPESQ